MLKSAVEQAVNAIDRYFDRSLFVEGGRPRFKKQSISKILGIRSSDSSEKFRALAINTASSLFRILEEVPSLDIEDPKKLKQYVSQSRARFNFQRIRVTLSSQTKSLQAFPDSDLRL